MSKTNLYAFFASEAISHIPFDQRDRCNLVLDEFDRSGKILVEIKRALKTRGIERGFKKITAKRPTSEPLIQIADLIAGAVHREITEGNNLLFGKIKLKLSLDEFVVNRKTT